MIFIIVGHSSTTSHVNDMGNISFPWIVVINSCMYKNKIELMQFNNYLGS